MYGIKLLLALVVISGIIAYVGDKIGMKVGKKRLSLFGLRPKYTSIIITVTTGILIALTSLILLMAASEDVRMALFDMEAMLERLSYLNQSLSTKNQELADLRTDIDDKVSSLVLLREDKQSLEKNLSNLKSEYQVVEDKKLKLESKVEKLNLQKEALTEQVDNLAYNISLFGKRYLSSLTEDIIYNKGDILATKSVNLEQSKSKIKNEVDQLLKTANALAINNGIKEEANNFVLDYNQQELDKVLEILNNKDDKAVLRLIVVKNTLKNESVAINFDLYQDYRVYQKGEVILEGNLSLSNKLSKLEEELSEVLDTLHQKSIEDGMLTDNKIRTGGFSLSVVSSILTQVSATEEIRDFRIIAIDDIWRSDNLNDKIDIKLIGD
ncbi:DUF3084 domain-containing protein [Orenia marismortui]|uniref:DUF3084 family protein n=1 Tax=Orenia marismortui TaxID=46469 RepID=A0A4R8HGJ7_9FIRM|nr:DUF3084 domain-containing protein [Orenia marismortui]TDX59222.1 hypothetical protein C7959_101109 [Orenia marismortui]